MDNALWHLLTGVGLFALGLRAALLHTTTLRRLLGLNVMGAGVCLMLIASAWQGPGRPPDPLPHALVLTGIVVAVSATALALALVRALARAEGDQEKEPDGH